MGGAHVQTLVLAFIGDDSPGLVHALAEVLSDHDGNWENSHMTSVGGMFAGVLEVSVAPDKRDALMEDFRALDGMLDVMVRPTTSPDVHSATTSTLQVTGPDGNGIVERFSAMLARSRMTMCHFASETCESTDGGAPVLRFTSSLVPCDGAGIDDLRADLAQMESELGVDVVVTTPPTA